MAERPTIDVPSPPGGWGLPWPNVAEIEAVLPHEKWTLVGGLMAQLHGIRAGTGVIRPTNDVDIVLHVETTRGVGATTAVALESLGYELARPLTPIATSGPTLTTQHVRPSRLSSPGDHDAQGLSDEAAFARPMEAKHRDAPAVDVRD